MLALSRSDETTRRLICLKQYRGESCSLGEEQWHSPLPHPCWSRLTQLRRRLSAWSAGKHDGEDGECGVQAAVLRGAPGALSVTGDVSRRDDLRAGHAAALTSRTVDAARGGGLALLAQLASTINVRLDEEGCDRSILRTLPKRA